jgi:hypothetical protein
MAAHSLRRGLCRHSSSPRARVAHHALSSPRVSRQDHSAYAYVWKDSALGLLEGPWSYEDKFLPVEAEFVANCQRFVAAGLSWEQSTFCDFDAGGGGGAAAPAPATGGDRVAIRDVKPMSPGGSPGRSS